VSGFYRWFWWNIVGKMSNHYFSFKRSTDSGTLAQRNDEKWRATRATVIGDQWTVRQSTDSYL
jgi:hypothetical protein